MVSIEIISFPDGADIEIIESIPLHTDMLILVSPQYKDDTDILAAIRTYISAVYADIGWGTAVLRIQDTQNDYKSIDSFIKRAHQSNPLKACIIVGEDMAENENVFSGSFNTMCHQSVVPWCTLSDYHFTPSCKHQVVVSQLFVHVPISLIYPNSNDNYSLKRNQLISVFNKFSIGRDRTYGHDLLGLCADNVAIKVKDQISNELLKVGAPVISVNPSQPEVDSLLQNKYKMCIAAGHGFPRLVELKENATYFYANNHGIKIDTPFLFLYGCGTNQWYTFFEDNCLYQRPSNRLPFFGHLIFDNPKIRVMMTGFPIGAYADEFNTKTGFLCSNGLGKMSSGMTIAEATQGVHSWGSYITLFGDPTFHF